jgi:hypothetical protein
MVVKKKKTATDTGEWTKAYNCIDGAYVASGCSPSRTPPAASVEQYFLGWPQLVRPSTGGAAFYYDDIKKQKT